MIGPEFEPGTMRPLLLGPNRDIALFASWLDRSSPLDSAEWESLSPKEVERARRLIRSDAQVQFVRGRRFLRQVLAERLETAPQNVCFEVGRAGKPRLAGDTPLQFNLSHSADLFVLALCDGREIGVDVEQIRDNLDWLPLARRYFATAEVEEIVALPLDSQREAFFRVWTRKEAYIKALGMGLNIPLDGFRVSVSDPGQILATPHDPAQLGRWQFHAIPGLSGFAGSICLADGSASAW